MTDLIIAELKKIYKNRILWGFLLLLAVADIYKINQMHRREANEIDGHDRIYAEVSGKITEEKLRFVIDHYRESAEKISTGNYSTEYNEDTYTGYDVGDYNEFEFFYGELQYVYEYRQEMEKLCERWEQKIQACQRNNRQYGAWQSRKRLLNYKNRSIDSYYDMAHAKIFLSYDFSTLLVIVAVFFIVPGMIFYERKNGMWTFMKTTAVDGKNLMGAKLMAAALLVLILTVFFGILDFICFQMVYGIEGLKQPLYSMEEYKYTVFSGTVLQFIFVQQIVHYFAYLFFSYFCLFVSFLVRDQTMTVLISVLGFAGLVLLCIHTEFFINPVALLENQELIKSYREIQIGNYGVCRYLFFYVSVIFMDLFLAAGLLVAAKGWKKPKKDVLYH